MAAFEIPLSPEAQTLTTQLGAGTYELTLLWSTIVGAWVLNIADTGAAPIVSGIPLVPGVDLLAQFAYLNFGGALIVVNDIAPAQPPLYAELGVTGHLYFITP